MDLKQSISGHIPHIPAQGIISLIVPLYNEADNILTLYERLVTAMQPLPYAWEMICINDGSQDETLVKLLQLREKDKRIQVVDFSRNFGKEAAMTAGLNLAIGDAMIPVDADLQDPPELIPELVKKWEEGFDVVNAVRNVREGESWLKRMTAHLFYRSINRMSKTKIPEDTGDFRLLSRPVVDALQQIPERRRFMKGLFAWVGFKTATIHYNRPPRHAGKTSWNYWKLWNFALEGITSFSQMPLQFASYLGIIVALTSILYGIFFLIRTLLYGNPIPGYPSLMVSVLFLGGVQLIALGVIGEYLGRVSDESKQRPIYIIRKKWTNRSDIS
ncbi:MAG TPA: glycosyltransferase family 2 protein [Gammaproteobacteria bacterium]|nr:glycosyltransferase family 2 protein [Gammaproteobacteria bacterium]